MFTWGPKYFLGLSVVAWLAAVAYGLITGGGIIGVVSFGYKGGVGEHFGYAVLMGVAFVCEVMAGVLFATRDGEAETLARIAGTDAVPQVTPPQDPSYWGPLSAFGVASLMLGVSVSSLFTYLGIAVLMVVAIEWVALAWSDRATGDPDTNRAVKDRVLGPIEIPMLGALGIAAMMIGISRIFLAVTKTGAVVAGSLITVVIFGTAIVLAHTNPPRQVFTAAIAGLALIVLGGGVVGAVMGERELEHHEPTGSDEGHSEDDGGTESEEPIVESEEGLFVNVES